MSSERMSPGIVVKQTRLETLWFLYDPTEFFTLDRAGATPF